MASLNASFSINKLPLNSESLSFSCTRLLTPHILIKHTRHSEIECALCICIEPLSRGVLCCVSARAKGEREVVNFNCQRADAAARPSRDKIKCNSQLIYLFSIFVLTIDAANGASYTIYAAKAPALIVEKDIEQT